MTRVLDADVLRAMQDRSGRFVHLLDLEFSGGTIYLTTAGQDIPWNGQTYAAAAQLLGVGAVEETQDPQAQGVELRLGGVTQTIISAILAQDYRGREAIVRRAYIAMADNRLPTSEDLTLYAGTAALTAGQADPLGGTRGYLVNDNSGGAILERRISPTFAASGPKGFGLWVKRGSTPSASGTLIRLRDTTAAANRLALELTFDADGVPSINDVTGSTLVVDDEALNWWLLRGLTAAVVAGNAHDWAVRPAGVGPASETGDVAVFGMQVTRAPAVPEHYVYTDDVAIDAGTIIGTPVEQFRGFMNEAFQVEEKRPVDKASQPTAEVSTRLVSRLVALEQQRGISCNLISHQRAFAGELFFQHVPDLMNRRIYWGVDAPPGS